MRYICIFDAQQICMINAKLKSSFYLQSDTVGIAKALLGKKLVSNIDGFMTAGIICETEAYCGTTDRGCHAYNGRYTERTKIMYASGGVSYIYICYGIHHLFNVVTHVGGEPHAVLIRAIEATDGLAHIQKRRGKSVAHTALGAGPGLVSVCLGLTTKYNGESLLGDSIWIEDAEPLADADMISGPRVGMNFSGPYKTIPWRFRILDSPFTSKAH